MKEKIEQLSKGEFIYELPEILLSVEDLNITIDSGNTFEGSFTIKNSNKTSIKGVLYSSNRFLRLETDRFIGKENTVKYCVLGKHLEAGKQITTSIHIISDCGEATLPVNIKVEEPGYSSSIGKVKDMFQFTNLAKTDWSEAKQLFKSDEFERLINYYDQKYSLILRGLQKSSVISQAMDEFLISIRKKVVVKLSVDKTDFIYESSKNSFMDKIVLTKEGWGYAQIRINTDAPFIDLDRKLIWADNFVNNSYDLNFVVNADKMKNGIHTGNIYITTVHQQIIVKVIIHCEKERIKERSEVKKHKEYLLKLMQNYLDFRFNRLNAIKYGIKAETLLEGMSNRISIPVFLELYRVHTEIISQKKEEALILLDALVEQKAAGKEFTATESGILLYLQTLLKNGVSDISSTVEEIKKLYAMNSNEWMLFWCLLYLDKSYEVNRREKLDDIKNVCMSGCKSPVLYYEALCILQEDPSLLKMLDKFELFVITFGLRHEVMTKDLARQISYLAARGRDNSYLLINALEFIYEKYKLKEALSALCTILIRSHKMDSSAYHWYRKGISEQLRITELPEYYLYSMNEEHYEEINHSVLTYFSYNNKLPDKKKAYLYANIINHKDSNLEIYKQYEKSICEFALHKLESRSISRDLAVIYNDVLHHVELDIKLAALIPEIAFYYMLECENTNMKSVVVVHKERKDEMVFPIVDGKAYIQLLTENSEIFLMDEKQERYHVTVEYTIFKLVYLDDLLPKCYELIQSNEKLLLHLSDKVHTYHKFDTASIILRKQVIHLTEIHGVLRNEYLNSLVLYYYDNYQGEILDSLISQIDLSLLDKDNRIKIMEIMIQRDLYSPVLQAMNEYGYEKIEVKKLLKLCSRVIMNEGKEVSPNNLIVELCSFVFKHGKYNETVLNYLVSYYYGTTVDMFGLWKVAKDFDVDTVELEERLLAQMLFVESYLNLAVSVFMSYYRSGYNRKLIRAFLSYYSYKYLVRNRALEPELFDVMKKEATYEKNDICILALLKFYSTKEILTDSEVNFIEYYMNGFEQKNIVLPFFQKFKSNMRVPEHLYDKYYVEHCTESNKKVMIHYSIEQSSQAGNIVTEEMHHVCYGIYMKEFILFHNETLQYHISEENAESCDITENFCVRISEEEKSVEETKYRQLNSILRAIDKKDETTINKRLEQYVKVDYAISKLFKQV